MPRVIGRSRELLLEQMLYHLRSALALCDEIAEPVPACHLQHAIDLLDPAGPRDGAPRQPH
jgi:hypothetical protein